MILHERWWFLFSSSLAHCVCRLLVDQTGPITARLSGQVAACRDGRDPSCLNLNSAEYNSLFVAHDWAACLGAAFTGFFLRKYGIWLVSIASAVLLLFGSLLFALGPYIQNNDGGALTLLLLGRIVFGAAMFCEVILSLQVMSHWFFKRELALAITVFLSAGRIGTVIAMEAGGVLVEVYGLQMTLWITFGVGIVAPVLTIVAGWIYRQYAARQIIVKIVYLRTDNTAWEFSKIRQLSLDFWIICAIAFLFYSVALGTLAGFSKYLIEAYGYSEALAGQIGGLIPILALLAPVFGWLVDKYGQRSTMTLFSTLLIFIAVICQAFAPGMPPAVTASFIGITYAICSASIWSSVSVVEDPHLVGIAMGISTAGQQFGVGLMILASGFLLNGLYVGRWLSFFSLQTGIAGVALVLAILSLYRDERRHGGRLRKPLVISEVDTLVDERASLLATALERRPSQASILSP